MYKYKKTYFKNNKRMTLVREGHPFYFAILKKKIVKILKIKIYKIATMIFIIICLSEKKLLFLTNL